MLLGIALRVLLATAAVATVGAIVVYIVGTITQSKLKEKLQEKGIKNAVIEKIDRCSNIVNLKELDSDQTIEVHGDDVSYDLDEGNLIYV